MLTKKETEQFIKIFDARLGIKLENKFEEKLGPIRGEIKGFREDVNGLKTDVSGLKKDVEGLKKQTTSMQADIVEIRTDVTGLKTGLKDVQTDLDKTRKELKAEMQALRISHENLKGGVMFDLYDHGRRLARVDTYLNLPPLEVAEVPA